MKWWYGFRETILIRRDWMEESRDRSEKVKVKAEVEVRQDI
jgi:hypothetical protein